MALAQKICLDLKYTPLISLPLQKFIPACQVAGLGGLVLKEHYLAEF